VKRLNYIINRLARALGVSRESYGPENEGSAFIVYNPAWPDPPRFWFNDVGAATKTAENLSKQQPHDSFYVMKAVLVVSARPETRELPGGSA